jgi:DNA-directed RNA polymerase subunit alpha
MMNIQENFISCVESRIHSNGQAYGLFHIGKFPRGQAVTLANPLRRTLLSAIPGIVVSKVYFAEKGHEFSTLPGIQEPILDLLLNIKGLVFGISDHTRSILDQKFQEISVSLTKKGPGYVTGEDFKLPSGLFCVNSQQHIATLHSAAAFHVNLELTVADPRRVSTKKIPGQFIFENQGFQLNSTPNPVKKVNYTIRNMDVFGSNEEFVILEIWTDGSVQPQQVLQFALTELTKFFFVFAQYSEPSLPSTFLT